MTVEYKRYIVGTKERPTLFLMRGGELSEDLEDAYTMMTRTEAEEEIAHCDEAENFQVFEVKISAEDL